MYYMLAMVWIHLHALSVCIGTVSSIWILGFNVFVMHQHSWIFWPCFYFFYPYWCVNVNFPLPFMIFFISFGFMGCFPQCLLDSQGFYFQHIILTFLFKSSIFMVNSDFDFIQNVFPFCCRVPTGAPWGWREIGMTPMTQAWETS